jgi:hypothetical protein
MNIYIYIYIERERERERESDSKREREQKRERASERERPPCSPPRPSHRQQTATKSLRYRPTKNSQKSATQILESQCPSIRTSHVTLVSAQVYELEF